jgi:hypothetical protein
MSLSASLDVYSITQGGNIMENTAQEPQGQDEEVLKVPTVSEPLATVDDAPLGEEWPQIIEAELARLEPTGKAIVKETFPDATAAAIDAAGHNMTSTWRTDFPRCQPCHRALAEARVACWVCELDGSLPLALLFSTPQTTDRRPLAALPDSRSPQIAG